MGFPLKVVRTRDAVTSSPALAGMPSGTTASVTGERTATTGRNWGFAGSQNSITLPPWTLKSMCERLVPVGSSRTTTKSAAAATEITATERRCAGLHRAGIACAVTGASSRRTPWAPRRSRRRASG
jgi:hypothetical protein